MKICNWIIAKINHLRNKLLQKFVYKSQAFYRYVILHEYEDIFFMLNIWETQLIKFIFQNLSILFKFKFALYIFFFHFKLMKREIIKLKGYQWSLFYNHLKKKFEFYLLKLKGQNS